MSSFIGLDYGTSSIGYAIGQDITATAQPKGRLMVREQKIDWTQLNEIIQTWQVEQIVLGYPLNMDGTEQKLSKKVRKFAIQLKEYTKLPVILVDERLSSVEARDHIFTSKSYKKLQKDLIDATSAAIILQSYLDSYEAIEIL